MDSNFESDYIDDLVESYSECEVLILRLTDVCVYMAYDLTSLCIGHY